MERDLQAIISLSKNIYFNSHAHVERDDKPQQYLQIVTNFNSHAHVERDILTAFMAKVQKISTHTLTWSVT